MTEYCNFCLQTATEEQEEEWCPNEALDGEVYCAEHLPLPDDDEWDWFMEDDEYLPLDFEGDVE